MRIIRNQWKPLRIIVKISKTIEQPMKIIENHRNHNGNHKILNGIGKLWKTYEHHWKSMKNIENHSKLISIEQQMKKTCKSMKTIEIQRNIIQVHWKSIFEEPMNIIGNHWKPLENLVIRGQLTAHIVGNAVIPEEFTTSIWYRRRSAGLFVLPHVSFPTFNDMRACHAMPSCH